MFIYEFKKLTNIDLQFQEVEWHQTDQRQTSQG